MVLEKPSVIASDKLVAVDLVFSLRSGDGCSSFESWLLSVAPSRRTIVDRALARLGSEKVGTAEARASRSACELEEAWPGASSG